MLCSAPFVCSPRVVTRVLIEEGIQCQEKVTGGRGRVPRQRDLKVRCHSLLDKRRGPESQERQENETC